MGYPGVNGTSIGDPTKAPNISTPDRSTWKQAGRYVKYNSEGVLYNSQSTSMNTRIRTTFMSLTALGKTDIINFNDGHDVILGFTLDFPSNFTTQHSILFGFSVQLQNRNSESIFNTTNIPTNLSDLPLSFFGPGELGDRSLTGSPITLTNILNVTQSTPRKLGSISYGLCIDIKSPTDIDVHIIANFNYVNKITITDPAFLQNNTILLVLSTMLNSNPYASWQGRPLNNFLNSTMKIYNSKLFYIQQNDTQLSNGNIGFHYSNEVLGLIYLSPGTFVKKVTFGNVSKALTDTSGYESTNTYPQAVLLKFLGGKRKYNSRKKVTKRKNKSRKKKALV
jgi:hypothetical protein